VHNLVNKLLVVVKSKMAAKMAANNMLKVSNNISRKPFDIDNNIMNKKDAKHHDRKCLFIYLFTKVEE